MNGTVTPQFTYNVLAIHPIMGRKVLHTGIAKRQIVGDMLYAYRLPARILTTEKVYNMNGYVCIWGRMRVEVEAATTFDAQQKALLKFKKMTRKRVRAFDITVVLAEADGKEVVHTPVD